ncbi:hypothetical protein M569_04100, partial [Genlisea aurea]
MVAAVSGGGSTVESQNPKTGDEVSRRPPLLPSEKDNSNGVSNNQRKPKSRAVSSRYMSPSSSSTSTSNSSSISSNSSSSRRFPSPLISRNSSPFPNVASSAPKRSVSVDRRRSTATRPLISHLDYRTGGGPPEVSAATKLLVTSTRSLSVSFQGEAFSLPISKTKVAPPPSSPSVRKGTPERKRTSTPSRVRAEGGGDPADVFKLADQHRWPGRNRLVNNPLSKSLNYSGAADDKRIELIGSGQSIRSLQQSMIIDERRTSFDGRLCLDLDSSDLLKEFPRGGVDRNGDYNPSDSDSASSGSTTGVHDSGGGSSLLNDARGMAVSARFWQETNSRLRRLQDPVSPLSSSPGSKMIIPPKMKRFSMDGSSVSSPRAMLSPSRASVANRAASPGKLSATVGSSPSRGYSPARIRNAVSTICNNFVETPSVLSFAVDIRRGKVGENRIVDAHLLRLLYNRHLQWSFVNARTETVLLLQKHTAEKNLWNAWIIISDLRDTVTKKRHRLQLVKQKLKLASILKQQMTLLEDWSSLEKDQLASLNGAIEALKASTLRLPVIAGASADVHSLKDSICSAVDVMQAVATSMCSLLQTVEEVNGLVTELAKLTNQERALLEQCTDFLSLLAALQVQDTSLRTHMIQ